MNWDVQHSEYLGDDEYAEVYDSIDGPSEEEAYRQGKQTINGVYISLTVW